MVRVLEETSSRWLNLHAVCTADGGGLDNRLQRIYGCRGWLALEQIDVNRSSEECLEHDEGAGLGRDEVALLA